LNLLFFPSYCDFLPKLIKYHCHSMHTLDTI